MTLREALEHCRTAWPGLGGEERDFIEHLSRHRGTEPGAHCADLYLAWACGRGDRRALELLEAEVMSEVAKTVERMKLPDGVLVAEIVQRVRERALLPRESGPPAILDYEGSGTLLNWLRTAAIREVVVRGRQNRLPVDDVEVLAELPISGAHPELALVRERFREPFRAAFRQAVAELESEQKNLLRLSCVDRVPLERLGTTFGVHKSTLSRRLAQIRARLLERTRALLVAELALAGPELDSLLRMVDASFEVSIPDGLSR